MNILTAINKNYTSQLNTLLKSIQSSNPKTNFDIYILNKDLTEQDIEKIKKKIETDRLNLHFKKIPKSEIDTFPVYEKRYPTEIYFRLFATKYLPKNLKRILYLDTDIVVINDLHELYNMDFEENYFIASTHIKKVLHKFQELRLGLDKNDAYINTGVLLMNLEILRNIPMEEEIIQFVKENSKKLMLPDQDILSALYGNKVKLVDEMKYNLGERAWNIYNLNNPKQPLDLNWIKKNTVIIHYYGRNKPWNKNYVGKLNIFYDKIKNKE